MRLDCLPQVLRGPALGSAAEEALGKLSLSFSLWPPALTLLVYCHLEAKACIASQPMGSALACGISTASTPCSMATPLPVPALGVPWVHAALPSTSPIGCAVGGVVREVAGFLLQSPDYVGDSCSAHL